MIQMNKHAVWLIGGVAALLIALATLYLFNKDKDFATLNGEIIMMQRNGAPVVPLIKYDPKKEVTTEIRNVIYQPQYNVNNPDQLIAVIDNQRNSNIQDVYAIWDDNGSYTRRQHLYSGEKVTYPKFVPSRNAISFITNNQLAYYNLDSKQLTLITNIESPYYDWLDSNTVLYTDDSNPAHSNIGAYNIVNHNKYVYKRNAAHPSLSFNKKFLAYQLFNAKNIVHIESLSENNRTSIQVTDRTFWPFKPSPDGDYLLANMHKSSSTDLVIIDTHTNQIKTISPSTFAEYLDWKP
ncbi:hypothetical protein [Paenibacillus sp. 481]|uniref:hypothetical protein n=1 Tax=Paenibacillus sp. 481 TaxID=2835869 RepID=UPI001E556B58|nr:hypothetical protein [Paenibacillus sp. 481]UHA72201.1 hypothetical protein KIK04_16050 [Paenibacillus sp. 481]